MCSSSGEIITISHAYKYNADINTPYLCKSCNRSLLSLDLLLESRDGTLRGSVLAFRDIDSTISTYLDTAVSHRSYSSEGGAYSIYWPKHMYTRLWSQQSNIINDGLHVARRNHGATDDHASEIYTASIDSECSCCSGTTLSPNGTVPAQTMCVLFHVPCVFQTGLTPQ